MKIKSFNLEDEIPEGAVFVCMETIPEHKDYIGNSRENIGGGFGGSSLGYIYLKEEKKFYFLVKEEPKMRDVYNTDGVIIGQQEDLIR